MKEVKLSWALSSPLNWHRLVTGHDKVPPFHKEWFHLLRTHRRIAIKAPRGHAKSEVFSVSYASWWAATHPNDLVMIFSANEYPQAQQLLKRIAHVLTSNSLTADLVKTVTKRRIVLTNKTEIIAAGVGVQVRGLAGVKHRPGLLIFDDILPDPDSPLSYEKVEEWFFDTAIPMGRPDTQVVVVGTPFTTDDLLAKLENNPEYEFRHYRALWTDEKGVQHVLWPRRFEEVGLDPLAELNRIKREIGPLAFARQYLCEPVDDTSSLFPRELILDRVIDLPLATPAGHPHWTTHGWKCVMGIDLAISGRASADAFAITVAWVKPLVIDALTHVILDPKTSYRTPLHDPPRVFERAEDVDHLPVRDCKKGENCLISLADASEDSGIIQSSWHLVDYLPDPTPTFTGSTLLTDGGVGGGMTSTPTLDEIPIPATSEEIDGGSGGETMMVPVNPITKTLNTPKTPHFQPTTTFAMVITHLERHVGLDYLTQLQRIITLAKANRPVTIAIESNGFQQVTPYLLQHEDFFRAQIPPETTILPITTTHKLKTQLPHNTSMLPSLKPLHHQIKHRLQAPTLPSLPTMQLHLFYQQKLLIPTNLPLLHQYLIPELHQQHLTKNPQTGTITIQHHANQHDDTAISTWLAFVAATTLFFS